MTAVWIALAVVFVALIPAIALGMRKSKAARSSGTKRSADDGGTAYLPASASSTRDPDRSDRDSAGGESGADGGGDGGGGGSD